MTGGVTGGFAGQSVYKSSVASAQRHDVATDGKQYTTGWGLGNKVGVCEIKDV